jgi:Secretion system C-terminal sorting domain
MGIPKYWLKTLNPLEAQGFVKFSIQAKPTAPTGAIIENTAYIYFDVNPVIITNTIALNVQRPLPVEWLSLAAKAGSNTAIHLDWQTASETNNSHFVVERSTDGVYFMPFGKINAKNSITGGSYAYIDAAVQPNTLYYYHIKQIDIDGKASYSNIVTAKITSKNGGLTLSPNPATAETILTWDNPIEEAVLQVLTNKGELVNSLSIPQGSTRFSLKLDGLASGVYFVSVKNKENAWYEKLIVK